jgi:hypothetical protein
MVEILNGSDEHNSDTRRVARPSFSRIRVATSLSVPVPILLDQSALTSLDEIFDSFTKPMQEYCEQGIADETEKDIEYSAQLGAIISDVRREQIRASNARKLKRDKRVCIAYLGKGRRVESDRFSGIVTRPHMASEILESFRYQFRIGAVEAIVEFSSRRYLTDFTVSVEPDDADVAQELFGALQNWAEGFQPSRWMQRWKALTPAFGFAAIAWIALAPMFYLAARLSGDFPTGSFATQAHELLAKGVTASNQTKAIELLLAIASSYSPGGYFNITPSIALIYASVAAALTILYCSPPNIIGVWSGKRRLQRWRAWVRVVWVTAPTLLLSTVVWPKLLHAVGLG